MDQRTLAQRAWAAARILNVRLRFIILMLLVGLVASNWERIQNRVDRWGRPARKTTASQVEEIEFYCPMHPNIIRDQPGNCPICGMPLAKRIKGAPPPLGEDVLAQVRLSPQKIQMGRIATTPVEVRSLARDVRAYGTVEFDETKIAHVSARFKGWLDHLYANYVGQRIEKGDPLFAIYSPDLLLAQQELLTALRPATSQPVGQPSVVSPHIDVNAARRKLRLWGITESQIDEIVQRGSAETNITILSPHSGVVTQKSALHGHYVNVGDELYTLADLSTIWVQARVFEDELADIKTGLAVDVTSESFPHEILSGQLSFISYTLDAATRTASARIEVANPDFRLKPGMYVRATIHLPPSEVLAAPASAVINTGTHSIVYRESEPGVFDMMEVSLGRIAGEFYPVLAGLSPGDRVATNGTFLIDAENRLNPAISAAYFGASDTKPHHGGHGE